MTDLPEPWQLYPMPPQQVDKIRSYVTARVEHEAAGRAADVAGALADLVRATDPSDPRYDAFREAYGVALEAAGLVPEEMRRRAGLGDDECGHYAVILKEAVR